MNKSLLCAIAAVCLLSACPPAEEQEPNNTNVVINTDQGNTSSADMGGGTDSGGLVDMHIDEGCQVGGCPETLVCNTATGICVDCVTNAECGANGTCDPTSNKCSCAAGFHLCDSVCSANDSVDSCGSSCDPCPSDPNGAATCDGTTCGLTCDAPLVLDPDANSCVGCASNNDCMGPAGSVCGAAGRCEPCVDDSGCSHLGALGTCDSGLCVECSTADDSACGGNSCDPSGNCTTTPKASVEQCEVCGADSECKSGHACVTMNFQGDLRSGAFCLAIDNGCAAPTPVSVSRTSLSGLTANFCTVNEDLTTCEAVDDYFANCADNSDCGAPGLDDGLCEAVDFEFAKCTYICDQSDECPSSSVIGCTTGNVGMKWCGAF